MPNPSFERLTESIGLLVLSVLCIGNNMVAMNLLKSQRKLHVSECFVSAQIVVGHAILLPTRSNRHSSVML